MMLVIAVQEVVPVVDTITAITTRNARPVVKRKQYCTAFKQQVINTALSIQNYREAGRMYSVTHRMIRKWELGFKKTLAVAVDKDFADSQGAVCSSNKETRTVQKLLNSAKKKRLPGAGRKQILCLVVQGRLKTYFDDYREQDLSVSLQCILSEYVRLLGPVSAAALSPQVLRMRIYRLFRSWDLSYRRKTQKAQNTRHCTVVMANFIEYVR
jgi:hypothetical protein